MSSNILQKDFSLLDEAINSVNQIKKTSIVFQDKSGKWKVLLLNDKESIYNDLETFDISDDNDCFIIINDNLKNIKRKKVQLTYDDTLFFAKVFSQFKTNEFFLNEKNNILEYLNSLAKNDNENIVDSNLSKTELLPQELYCYFKSFIPKNMIIEPILNNENIKELFLYIKIFDKKALEVLEPLFRRNKNNLEEIDNIFKNNNSLSIKLKLKEKILSLIHDEIKQKGSKNCMSIINPLGKKVLNNLINYEIVEIN